MILRALNHLYSTSKTEQNFNIQILAVEIATERIAHMIRTQHPKANDQSQYVSI